MAIKKQSSASGGTSISWKNLFVSASVALNIAFLVLFITMISTNKLDVMFIQEGMNRYCKVENDILFVGSSDQTKALRKFTCATGDAREPFEKAFNDYLKTQ